MKKGKNKRNIGAQRGVDSWVSFENSLRAHFVAEAIANCKRRHFCNEVIKLGVFTFTYTVDARPCNHRVYASGEGMPWTTHSVVWYMVCERIYRHIFTKSLSWLFISDESISVQCRKKKPCKRAALGYLFVAHRVCSVQLIVQLKSAARIA